MNYDDHDLIVITLYTMMVFVVDYVKYDHIYLHVIKVKIWVFLFILGDHVRLWPCIYVCSLRIDVWFFLLSYMGIMMVILMKYVYVLFCRLVSLTWYMYIVNMTSWLSMLELLSLVSMIDIWHWTLLRRSFLWNLQPSWKVIN